jgi:Na+-translocating ferredoxin:NAD+ oxidoreductase RnfD subunit
VATTGEAPPSPPAVPSAPAVAPPRGKPSVRLFGRAYPVLLPSIRDPRLHVAAVLLTLQVLGQTVLDFRLSIAQIVICLAAGALIEFGVAFFKDKVILWPASGLLTGNSTAFILRVPGTLHGQWWSLHGVWIFVGVVAVSMASKYLIRWKGRHIFNPSNLGLVLAFVALGPQFTEPQDLWWIPFGPWMIVTYAILIGGGLLIGWELKLLGLELGFMAAFALFVALALAPVPDHCMIASWHATPMCGQELWTILVTSPEVLIFALFMIPDPRTVPDGQASRFVFGVIVALLSVLLLGPTTLEFWTKTAILGSLIIACAGRFALAQLMEPFDEGFRFSSALRQMSWRAPASFLAVAVCVGCVPVAADISTHYPVPAAELSDGTLPTVTLTVGDVNDPAVWAFTDGADSLPTNGGTGPVSGSARVWVLPYIPPVTVPSNVTTFDPTISQQVAAQMAHDVVLDLMIESEARRAHDVHLAAAGAEGDALTEFTDVISADGGKIIQKTYSFTSVTLSLFLPKFSTQAPRLVGVTLSGSTVLTTRDASGHAISSVTQSYSKSWGLGSTSADGTHRLIINDYTGLTPA